MTLDEFNKLPLMVSRRHIMAVTGWANNTFYKHVRVGKLKPVASTDGGHARFRREDLRPLVQPA